MSQAVLILGFLFVWFVHIFRRNKLKMKKGQPEKGVWQEEGL